MKKVILTGSSGLIGKEAIEPLKNAGFEVYCPTSKECDLLDCKSIKKYFEKIKPRHLLHFAWITGGDYLINPLNGDLVDGSLEMLKVFQENGGKRAVFAGTCFEYEFKDSPIKENDNLNPTTLYALSKDKLRRLGENFCKENGVSFGWGRIFYVYGHNEKEGRLTSTIIDNLEKNNSTTINCGNLVRDYMYSKDIAGAFVKFLDSNVDGCVNICTKNGITLGDYAKTIAEKSNKGELVTVKSENSSQPQIIVGDNTRLIEEVEYKIHYKLQDATEEIIGK